MNKYFSNAESSFYLEETVQAYEAQGIPVPSDLMKITDSEYETFMVSPDRKTPQFNMSRHCMEWVDIAPPSKKEAIDNADSLKAQLMSVATQEILPLQDALDLEMATEKERILLTEWKKYRVLLSRVDTNKAPDIEWPESPLRQ
ncbi:tail fiber assembly protein [Enterobacter cloacae]|uniref:tail fiber assembly protein n=1 Tax=Enterobacter cloacae TaxID=550 RepID=UPI00062C631E|nr:tail fiber assembly protein [Enterobacter cloacae]ELK7438701.1 tail fiber assembly protein [Enterobacter cloacae]KKY86989.1 tail fiber assembly protein [Enterobacter cloacae]KLQ39174.1 tail fiber assembly protein [Enterobacter cloacae subsp. dissolvens]MCK7415355.1 tail fiber assembly protein [Enterobacter cloacae]MCK7437430.1 tail fiber assembly protein [Enterobacter cloacae]